MFPTLRSSRVWVSWIDWVGIFVTLDSFQSNHQLKDARIRACDLLIPEAKIYWLPQPDAFLKIPGPLSCGSVEWAFGPPRADENGVRGGGAQGKQVAALAFS
jgi:hypothetical protein